MSSLFIESHKHLSENLLNEIHEMSIAYNTQRENEAFDDGNGDTGKSDQKERWSIIQRAFSILTG